MILAVSLAGLGVLSLVFGDFALVWQPVPAWVPWRANLAYASGLVMLAGGLGMLLQRTARLSTSIVTVYLLLWLLLLRAPRVAAHPTSEGMWLGFGENLALVAGAWILLASLAQQGSSPNAQFGSVRASARGSVLRLAASDEGVRVARFLYAVALPVIGLSHFVYVNEVAALVPAWLPLRTGFAYLTGAGHIAAGIGLLFGIYRRLAATAEAIMISLFTLLVPRVVTEPASRMQWTALFISAAIAGAAWAVAGSLAGTSWGQAPWTARGGRVIEASDRGE